MRPSLAPAACRGPAGHRQWNPELEGVDSAMSGCPETPSACCDAIPAATILLGRQSGRHQRSLPASLGEDHISCAAGSRGQPRQQRTRRWRDPLPSRVRRGRALQLWRRPWRSSEAAGIDALRDLWTNAGIEAFETREIVVQRTFVDFEDFWTTSTKGPGAAVLHSSAMTLDAVRQLKQNVLRK